MDYTKMRRADRAMRREAALETIDLCTFGTLAMCAPDGTPYAVALNLVRDGDRLYYHAATEGLKAGLLRQNPKVCALFVDGAAVDEPGLTTYYASAVVRGTAREITDADEKRRALRLLCARFAPSIPAEKISCIESGPAYTAVWCIEIESVTGKQNAPKA